MPRAHFPYAFGFEPGLHVESEVTVMQNTVPDRVCLALQTGDGLHFLTASRERWAQLCAAVEANFTPEPEALDGHEDC